MMPAFFHNIAPFLPIKNLYHYLLLNKVSFVFSY
jgi:hypothetical protein